MDKVYVFAIGKLENKYIREWTEHYKSIGVDKIILADNNDIDGEKFEEVIGDYIDEGFVIIEDYRGKTTKNSGYNPQIYSYQNSFLKYGSECDWVGIFDCDEFLYVPCEIHEFLSRNEFKDYGQICFRWRNYNDNGLVKANGNYGLQNRFTTWKPSIIQKSIIRTSIIKNGISIGIHASYCEKTCTSNGIQLPFPSFIDESDYANDIAYIKHYRTKTIEEFLTSKIKRGHPEDENSFKPHMFFLMGNERTIEKLKVVLDMGFIIDLNKDEKEMLINNEN